MKRLLIAAAIAFGLFAAPAAAQVIQWGYFAGTTFTGTIFTTSSANPAQSGLFRMTNTGSVQADEICWRNAGLSADACIGVDGSNNLNLAEGTTALGITTGASAPIVFGARSQLRSTADALLQHENNAGTSGLEWNTSAAALGACGTGTLATGSKASAGQATSTGSTTCAITFGTNFTNIPFCTVSDLTTTGGAKISTGPAVGGFTVTVTSNDVFSWTCLGRI